MRARRTLAATLLVAGALLAGGCGDEEDTTDVGEVDTVSETVEVSLSDFEIDPPEIDLAEAGTVEFEVTNDGETTHAFEIEGNDVEAKTDELEPGESDTLTVDLDEGTYELYCPVGSHADMGMVGTLTVGDAGGGTTTSEDEGDDDDNSGSGGSGSGY